MLKWINWNTVHAPLHKVTFGDVDHLKRFTRDCHLDRPIT